MPGGIINPNGRINLNESSRDMTPPFWGESDRQLKRDKKGKSKNPYNKIKLKNELRIIEITWNLIFKSKKEKGAIIKLIQEQYNINKTRAEVFYYRASNKGNSIKK